MTPPLYNRDILRRAVAVADFPPLSRPDVRVARRSALCGSMLTLDLALDETGRVSAVGLDLAACALGQAAAATLARAAAGRDPADFIAVSDAFARWLDDRDAPLPDWPDMALLEPVRDFPTRHGSVRLAFDAAAEAARRLSTERAA